MGEAGLTAEIQDDGESGSPPLTGGPVLTFASASSLPAGTGDLGAAVRDLAERTRGPVLLVRAGRGESDEGLTHQLSRLRAKSASSGKTAGNDGSRIADPMPSGAVAEATGLPEPTEG